MKILASTFGQKWLAHFQYIFDSLGGVAKFDAPLPQEGVAKIDGPPPTALHATTASNPDFGVPTDKGTHISVPKGGVLTLKRISVKFP